MSAFKDKIEADILNIHVGNGGESSDEVKQQIADAVAPISTALQETQDALTDLAEKLSAGDTDGAQAALTTAQDSLSTATAPTPTPDTGGASS